MNERKRQRLQAFEIEEATIETLRPFRSALHAEIDGILDGFYEHMLEFPEMRRRFSDQDSVKRAGRAQRRHWLDSLLAQMPDTAYFKKASDVADAHLRVGLTPEWYIAGYSYVLKRFMDLLIADDAVKAPVVALNKLVLLDIASVIETFIGAKNRLMVELLRRTTAFSEEAIGLCADLDERQRGLREQLKDNSSKEEMLATIDGLCESIERLRTRLDELRTSDKLVQPKARARTESGLFGVIRKLFK
ncbi:MAG: hypothetical protein KC503_20370 [Myxococcales bacterium]|nr:hypothetical protein [Myxococcales bacterium]